MGEDNQLPLDQLLSSRGHTANLQGKPYVLLSGLLEVAHNYGLESIITEPIEIDMPGGSAVFRCTASGERGTFTGHGDSTPRNTGKKVAAAFIRMAETRAVCRALRFYLGIGMTARDELPGDADQTPPPAPVRPIALPPAEPVANWPAVDSVLNHCSVDPALLSAFFGSVSPSRDLTEAGAWLGAKIESGGLLGRLVENGEGLPEARRHLQRAAAESLKTQARPVVEEKLRHVGDIESCPCVLQISIAFDSLAE
jgi:hypothetical protein